MSSPSPGNVIALRAGWPLVFCLLLPACSSESSGPDVGASPLPRDTGAIDAPPAAADRAADRAASPEAAVDSAVFDLAGDLAPPGTKKMGEHCLESVECEGEAICAAGEYTSAHCTPVCTDNAPCIDEANNVKGSCTPVGGFEGNICMFFCGFMADGGDCPGDLVCQGGAVCR